jgi:hypothetical protein
MARLLKEPESLGPALRAAHPKGRGLLLFVDQLEELVTLSEPAQAERFARFLGELGELTVSTASVRVLLAVRGDFLTRVGALPGLEVLFKRQPFLLRPLSAEGLREAITGPAERCGVDFESIQPLVDATPQGAGWLPLFQFALAQLWERRDPVKGLITRKAIEEMGGVAGALSLHADAVLARLPLSGQQAARRMFGGLITAEGTRSERGEEELTGTSPEAPGALRALVEGRLLHVRTVGERARYEIAHEALITSWGTLRQWLDEDAGLRALRQRIELAGAEWARLGRPSELLWRKRQLEEAQALESVVLKPHAQDFLRASQHAVRRQRLLLRLAALLLVLGVGAYGGLRLQQYLEDRQFTQERLAAAGELLALAREEGQRASDARREALALFDGLDPDGSYAKRPPQQREFQANAVWGLALESFQRANEAYDRAGQVLDDPLERLLHDPEARQLRIVLTYERLLLAEDFHRMEESARLTHDFERLTVRETDWRKRLDVEAELEVRTRPPGAQVELLRYEEVQGIRQPVPVPGFDSPGTTPLARSAWKRAPITCASCGRATRRWTCPCCSSGGSWPRSASSFRTRSPRATSTFPWLLPHWQCRRGRGAGVHAQRAPAPALLQGGLLHWRYEVTLGDWMEYLDSGEARPQDRSLLEKPRPGMAGALSLQPLPKAPGSSPSTRGRAESSRHVPASRYATPTGATVRSRTGAASPCPASPSRNSQATWAGWTGRGVCREHACAPSTSGRARLAAPMTAGTLMATGSRRMMPTSTRPTAGRTTASGPTRSAPIPPR